MHLKVHARGGRRGRDGFKPPPMLNHHMANQCTKFEVSSFSHSRDIVGGTKNLNRSLLGWFFILLVRLDTAHPCTKNDSSSISHSWVIDGAPKFKTSHVTLPRPFQVRFVVRMLGLAMSDLCTKFEISTLTHYKDMKGDEKCKNLGGLGGIMGRSPEVISNTPFDRAQIEGNCALGHV